ncbi:hypothetical protein QTP86_010393 [Hemibagrus guttatus]|nr:hypothetical protein QTP86_010393 [Hemibagrus guttatus]
MLSFGCGGQRRRVSLGAALLQNPQLLILDEPTVGVDPVLRAKIWQHLVQIVQGGQVSVIITTHYIEEARQANMVGLMRNGRLLAEENPEEIMRQHNAATLESAFLQLCEDSDQVGSQDSPRCPDHSERVSPASLKDECREPILGKEISTPSDTPKLKADWKVRARHVIPKCRNIVALTIKTMVRMRRNPGSLCFQFLLPVIQICLMCLCIGGDPNGIKVAVVNNETSSSAYSRSLLSFLDNTSIYQVSLSHSAAFEGIHNGEYWGIIEFGENFTTYLTKRMLHPRVSRDVVEGGSVHVWLDLTNRQIGIMLQKKLHEAFQAFVESKMGSQAYLVSVPVKFEEPIFGSQNTTFTTFVTPGAVLSITFYLAVGLTALSFVLERKEGLLDRCWVAGVSSLETMLAHLFSQILVISVQITLLLLFILLVFKDAAEPTGVVPPAAAVRPAAEGPGAAAAPDLTESEPQAQPAAQKPTGATPAPEKPRTAEPATAEPHSARPDQKKPWSTEKSSVGSGAVLEPPALSEAGTEVQGDRMETLDTTLVQGDGGDVDMVDEPVFKIPNEGSLFLIICLIVLQGVTGISFGLVISSAIDDEQSANQAALGIFYPNLIISGVIWPVECIPYPLRYLSLVLPQTYASEALRCIMYRGWGLSRMMVWRGFAVTLGWNTFFLMLATIILKLRT